jgi:hypothetical protein
MEDIFQMLHYFERKKVKFTTFRLRALLVTGDNVSRKNGEHALGMDVRTVRRGFLGRIHFVIDHEEVGRRVPKSQARRYDGSLICHPFHSAV